MKNLQKKLMICSMLLTGCSSRTPSIHAGTPLHLITATDTHYLSSSLYPNESLFLQSIAQGDGKTVMYMEEIMEALISRLNEELCDAFILTGDLTLNGEYQSHIDFSKKLAQIEENGIPVLVIPGNHDLNNANAVAFTNEGYEHVASVSKDTFETIYADFGFNEALSKDSDSLSYTYAINQNTLALMLDVNGSDTSMVCSDTTLKWVEKQLQKAQKNGWTVLAFSHQNFLNHAPLFTSGYQIRNADQLLILFETYGVQAGFSGHLHIQHIASEGSFTEAATSSIAITENHYGVITVEEDAIQYESHSLDVSAWAKENDITNEELLYFDTFSADYFDQSMTTQISYPEEDLISYIQTINRAYFTGHMDTVSEIAQANELLAQKNDFMSLYILDYVLAEKENMNAFLQKRED